MTQDVQGLLYALADLIESTGLPRFIQLTLTGDRPTILLDEATAPVWGATIAPGIEWESRAYRVMHGTVAYHQLEAEVAGRPVRLTWNEATATWAAEVPRPQRWPVWP